MTWFFWNFAVVVPQHDISLLITSRFIFASQLQGALADIEQEKFEMQKEHTKGIQDILEDTNNRLQKMETEYSNQVEKHVSLNVIYLMSLVTMVTVCTVSTSPL